MGRILMTIDAVGGVWRYAMDLARGLTPRGHTIAFAGSGPKPDLHQMEEALGLGSVDWLDSPLDWMASSEAAFGDASGEIARLAARRGADVIHLNLPSQGARLRTDIPVLAVSHSCVVTWWEAVRGGDLPPEWEWQKARNRDGLCRADIIVAPSGSHAESLRRCYGPLDIEVVENGASIAAISAPEEPFIFAAGRWWDEGKNGAALDRAAAHLPWPVRMAGATRSPTGQELPLAHAEALGHLPHESVLEITARAAVFVSPSRYEPFGLSALEAASLGRPLVLADIPTYRELWRDAALFFPAGDADRLTGSIHELMGNQDLRRRLGAAARERSRLFTLERQARRMDALYRAAIARAETGRQEQVA